MKQKIIGNKDQSHPVGLFAVERLGAAVPQRPALNQRAMALWPGDEYLQQEWMRAVGVVRQTKRGWLSEVPAEDYGRYEQLRAAASSSA